MSVFTISFELVEEDSQYFDITCAFLFYEKRQICILYQKCLTTGGIAFIFHKIILCDAANLIIQNYLI